MDYYISTISDYMSPPTMFYKQNLEDLVADLKKIARDNNNHVEWKGEVELNEMKGIL